MATNTTVDHSGLQGNVMMLPGTEVMEDDREASRRDIPVPLPSDNPHDPLNWTPFWKFSAFLAASSVTFTQGLGPLSQAPLFEYYVKDFNCSLTQAVQFTGITVIVLGFSNLLWVPMSHTLGRRPVYILSQMLGIGAAIWRSRATSYESFLGASALSGIASGPSEAVQPEVIADVFFLRDRGKLNTIYWTAWASPLLLGPVIAGAMALHVGWRNFWWFNVGMLTLSLAMVIFMFPETKYLRSERAAELSSEQLGPAGASAGEKTESFEHGLASTSKSIEGDRTSHIGHGRPSKSQWKLWNATGAPMKSFAVGFLTPWIMFAFPIVDWAGLMVAFSCSCFLALNLTQAQVFGAAPYNFSSQSVGFLNFAILAGILIGLSTAGPLSDWISKRQTRKNGGIREPEMRLLAIVPYTLIMFFGNIIVSVGYQYKWPWEAVVIIGYVCGGIQVAALPAIASTYAVDSYKPAAGSAFVTIQIYKNVFAYGLSRFITPWTLEVGFIPPIMTVTAIFALWCLFGILFYFKGKIFRRWSRHSFAHRL